MVSRNCIDYRVIDVENDREIWAEEVESDYECEFDENYDGALLDMDVQTIDGESTSYHDSSNGSLHY